MLTNQDISTCDIKLQALGKEGRGRAPFHGQPMPSVEILPRVWHSAKKSFAECLCLPSARHSAKKSLPSAILCRVQRSAKKIFAECPIFDTRQRNLHSAKSLFPVVYVLTVDLDGVCFIWPISPVRLFLSKCKFQARSYYEEQKPGHNWNSNQRTYKS